MPYWFPSASPFHATGHSPRRTRDVAVVPRRVSQGPHLQGRCPISPVGKAEMPAATATATATATTTSSSTHAVLVRNQAWSGTGDDDITVVESRADSNVHAGPANKVARPQVSSVG